MDTNADDYIDQINVLQRILRENTAATISDILDQTYNLQRYLLNVPENNDAENTSEASSTEYEDFVIREDEIDYDADYEDILDEEMVEVRGSENNQGTTSEDNLDTSEDNLDTSENNLDTSEDNLDTSEDNLDTSEDNLDTCLRIIKLSRSVADSNRVILDRLVEAQQQYEIDVANNSVQSSYNVGLLSPPNYAERREYSEPCASSSDDFSNREVVVYERNDEGAIRSYQLLQNMLL